mgnify:CR=1 FL=1
MTNFTMRYKQRKVLMLAGVVIIIFILLKLFYKHSKTETVPRTIQNLDVDTYETSKSKIIQDLANKYNIDWNYKLTSSPWTIAAKWATETNIIPRFVPELGK